MCVWVDDADKLNLSSHELNIVYKNRNISAYLKNSNSLGLAGIKGQGKTFLIKVKRKCIMENNTAVCFPYNRIVDTIDSCINIDNSLYNYLMDYNMWVNLWKFSICGTILTSNDFKEYLDLSAYNSLNLKADTKSVLELSLKLNSRSEPSFLLKQLLQMDIHLLRMILTDTWKLFDRLRDINRSVCIFIDKLDQGFSEYAKNFNEDSKLPGRSRNASFWQYVQYSLAESAYDIYTNGNQHIKVYYTIRHEALIDSIRLNKDKARNIESFITLLDYSKNDLKQMYKLYIENEDKSNLKKYDSRFDKPSEAFIGVEEIKHGYVSDEKENVFDYIYRHTFKRPYDIMKICGALFSTCDSESCITTTDIRHVVNNEANKLLTMYLEEISVFLPCTIEDVEYLAKMLSGNILNIQLIKTICQVFDLEHSSNGTWNCNQDCRDCRSLQPFSILYNIGLIGYTRQHEADGTPLITFENIGRSVLNLNSFILPHSDYYYLHPALSNKARDLRNKIGLPFNTISSIIIGDRYGVASDKKVKISASARKSLNWFKKELVFVSSTIFDLEKERTIVRETLKKRGLHPIMSEYEEFNTKNTQDTHSHDHCLDEVKKCKSFVFIIGKSYGGEYSGNNYVKEKEEIVEQSAGKIVAPSISMMEYYIARKNNLKCYIFMSSEIEEKRRKRTINNDLKAEIDFLNHFKPSNDKIKGNWITIYNNTSDLATRLRACKFV